MALHGSLGLTLSRVAFEVWPLTTQYPLASQGALHRLSTTVYLAYIVSAFILALVGRVSWWHIRLLFAVFPSNRFLPLVGLHVLEVLSASTPSLEAGSLSGEKTVLLLRRPTHACFYTICRASDTVAQAWLLAGVEVIAVCLIALLSSPATGASSQSTRASRTSAFVSARLEACRRRRRRRSAEDQARYRSTSRERPLRTTRLLATPRRWEEARGPRPLGRSGAVRRGEG